MYDKALVIDGIKAKEFERISRNIKLLCGINMEFTEKNVTLIRARLNPVMAENGFTSLDAFMDLVEAQDPVAIRELIQALTTNTTQFFREIRHFTLLDKIIPEIMQEKLKMGSTEIRVWCAACSSGQEVYSIAMSLLNAMEGKSVVPKILASDVDAAVLRKAKNGVYTPKEMEAVNPLFLQKYFSRRVKSNGHHELCVKPSIKEHIRFYLHNLVDREYPFEYKFDIVFCRNVFIYFDQETINRILGTMKSHMAKGSYLFLGHAEGMGDNIEGFTRIAPSVYRKNDKE